MLFNSFTFLLVFLPAVCISYRWMQSHGRFTEGKLFLVIASLFFYAQAGLRNLPCLVGSLLFNYIMARAIAATVKPARRRLLVLGITANIAFLCSFKYVNFFFDSLFRSFELNLHLPSLAFPLGISFYTVQQIMYLVDCYEEMSKPNTLLDHSVFASLFAYITAGPITRSRDVVPQLNSSPVRRASEDTARALTLLAIGLGKKVILADSFASVANAGFKNTATLSFGGSWISILAYTFQLYFDFSGYSDMAMAVALFLGIRIPKNFDNPFISRSITEFWRRWHMTLTNFLTTYLYTPLLKSFKRITLANSIRATLITMIIIGAWHGPGWTFIIFGAMHGIGLSVNQYRKKKKASLPGPIAWGATLFWVVLAFVFFRSPTLGVAGELFAGMFGFHGFGGIGVLVHAVSLTRLSEICVPIAIGTVIAFLGPTSNKLADEFRPSFALGCGIIALLLASAFYMNSIAASTFIYAAF